MGRSLVCCLAILAALVNAGALTARAQDDASVGHARQVLDLLRQDKFEDVSRQFDPQMGALLSSPQLAAAWAAFGQQAGAFVSVIDQHVRKPAAGTTVILGCQFEKMTINFIVSFDAENRIAGLRFLKRDAASLPSDATPASSRFNEEPITVGAAEWALPGTLSMPVGPIAGALVLVHGSGPSDRDETVGANKPFRDLAWGLADRGIAVLRYEKRTRRYAARMAGIKNLTVQEETIDDALAAAARLRTHDRIDPRRVFVLGHSLGGTLAPRIAAEDRALAGIVILAGATRSFEQIVRDQFAYLASLAPGTPASPAGSDAVLQMLRRNAPESYWKDLDAYNPAQTAAHLTLPMLILQGERDYQVTLDDLQGWRNALKGHAGVTIKTYPRLNHLFMPGEGKSTPAEYEQPNHVPDAVINDIAEWISHRR